MTITIYRSYSSTTDCSGQQSDFFTAQSQSTAVCISNSNQGQPGYSSITCAADGTVTDQVFFSSSCTGSVIKSLTIGPSQSCANAQNNIYKLLQCAKPPKYLQMTTYTSSSCTGAINDVDVILLNSCNPYNSPVGGYAIYTQYILSSGLVQINSTIYSDAACHNIVSISNYVTFTAAGCTANPYGGQQSKSIYGVGAVVPAPTLPSNFLVAQ
jgi:hypothetical protein